jgi:hypothetical protein
MAISDSGGWRKFEKVFGEDGKYPERKGEGGFYNWWIYMNIGAVLVSIWSRLEVLFSSPHL